MADLDRVTSRTLGLSAPVAEALDPELWRQRAAYGLVGALGTAASSTGTLQARLERARALALARTGTSPTVSADVAAVARLPDDTIRWQLRAALSELELKLGLPMGVQVCKATPADDGLVLGRDYDRLVPRLPYTMMEALSWYLIPIPSSVISVERIRGWYFGQLVWELSAEQGNEDLIRVIWARQGQIRILPTHLQSIAVTQDGNYGIWQTIFLHQTPVPDFWGVDYTLGPVTNDGKPGELEIVLIQWVYLRAATVLFTLGGFGASHGVASANVSLDGASKNVSFSSPAVLKEATDAFERHNDAIDWKAIRTQKRGLRVRAFAW